LILFPFPGSAEAQDSIYVFCYAKLLVNLKEFEILHLTSAIYIKGNNVPGIIPIQLRGPIKMLFVVHVHSAMSGGVFAVVCVFQTI